MVIYGNQGQTMMDLYTSETIKHPIGITLKNMPRTSNSLLSPTKGMVATNGNQG